MTTNNATSRAGITEFKNSIIPLEKWIKKTGIKFWENEKPQFVQGAVFLSQDVVTKTLSVVYEPFSRDCHFITYKARHILSHNFRLNKGQYQEDEIFGAEKAVNESLDRVSEYFSKLIEQGKIKLNSVGFEFEKMSHGKKGYETKNTSPMVTRLIDICAQADIYLSIMMTLHITGELSNDSNEAQRAWSLAEQAVRQNILSLVRLASTHYQNLYKICQAVVQYRKKQNEERKAKQAAKRKEKLLAKKQEADEAATQKEQNKTKAKKKKPEVAVEPLVNGEPTVPVVAEPDSILAPSPVDEA